MFITDYINPVKQISYLKEIIHNKDSILKFRKPAKN